MDRKVNLPFRFKAEEHLQRKIVISGEDRHTKLPSYRGQDFGDGGN
jgi:hypothetical protein